MTYFFGILATAGWVWAGVTLAVIGGVVWRRQVLARRSGSTSEATAHGRH